MGCDATGRAGDAGRAGAARAPEVTVVGAAFAVTVLLGAALTIAVLFGAATTLEGAGLAATEPEPDMSTSVAGAPAAPSAVFVSIRGPGLETSAPAPFVETTEPDVRVLLVVSGVVVDELDACGSTGAAGLASTAVARLDHDA